MGKLQPKTILLVDDHAAVRLGLKAVLSEINKDVHILEASGGRDALDILNSQKIDAVLLDIDLPDISGLEVLRQLRQKDTSLPVLVLSMYGEEQYSVQVLKAGASGYISKQSAADELVHAVSTVLQGKRYVSDNTAQVLAEFVGNNQDVPSHDALSKREFQVLRMTGSGKSTQEIADTLGVNIKTVFTYKARIIEKMGFKSASEMVRYAVEHKLV